MEQKTSLGRPFRFGTFEVDLRAGELRKQGVKVKLQEQPLQVLAMLLEHPGEVITREELQQRIWPADTFVDFQNGLNKAINKLREALGDSVDTPRFVETLPRRGYRFIASVDGIVAPAGADSLHASDEPAAAGEAGLALPMGTQQAEALVPRRRWPVLVAVALGLLIALLVGLNMGGLRDRLRGTSQQIHSIAVLPLENLTGDSSQEYFADGMTEALITDLGKTGGLRVISRTSAMHYKGTRRTLPQIARELNVDAVVEGAVFRSGNRVRITAQLIRAIPEKHLWSESYERDLRDILALQSDVARAVAAQVHITLTPQEQQRLGSVHPVNPDVYRTYLKVHFFLNNQRSREGAQKAVQYSLEATRLDPNSALAFAVLAESYTPLGYLEGARPHEYMPKARAAAERALALDPDLAEAHSALGWILVGYSWDWRGAERELKRALELNPSDSGAHLYYSSYLRCMGQMDEAVTEAKRARELDPLSMNTNRAVGAMLYFARRYDEALVELRQTAEMFPNSEVVFNWLSNVYRAKGNAEKAVEMDLKDRANAGESPERLAALRRAFETSGMPGYWEKRLQLARQDHRPHQHSALGDSAVGNIDLGRYQEAFEWMEKSYKEHLVWITWIKVDPRLDPIRSDPRFKDLVRRMGLPP